MVLNKQNKDSSGDSKNSGGGDLAARLSRLEARVSKLEGNKTAPNQKPTNFSDDDIFDVLHS